MLGHLVLFKTLVVNAGHVCPAQTIGTIIPETCQGLLQILKDHMKVCTIYIYMDMYMYALDCPANQSADL